MASLTALSELTQERYCMASSDRIRRRALDRLYARRVAVDKLIDSLEQYQVARAATRGNCVPIASVKAR